MPSSKGHRRQHSFSFWSTTTWAYNHPLFLWFILLSERCCPSKIQCELGIEICFMWTKTTKFPVAEWPSLPKFYTDRLHKPSSRAQQSHAPDRQILVCCYCRRSCVYFRQYHRLFPRSAQIPLWRICFTSRYPAPNEYGDIYIFLLMAETYVPPIACITRNGMFSTKPIPFVGLGSDLYFGMVAIHRDHASLFLPFRIPTGADWRISGQIFSHPFSSHFFPFLLQRVYFGRLQEPPTHSRCSDLVPSLLDQNMDSTSLSSMLAKTRVGVPLAIRPWIGLDQASRTPLRWLSFWGAKVSTFWFSKNYSFGPTLRSSWRHWDRTQRMALLLAIWS